MLVRHICKTLLPGTVFFLIMLLGAVPGVALPRDAEWADSVVRAAAECYKSRDMTAAVDGLYTLVRKADSGAAIPAETTASACLTLANIYLVYSDFTSAVKYYEKGINLTDDSDLRMILVNNLTVVNCILGDERQARHNSAELAVLRPKNTKLHRFNQLICSAYIEKAFGSRNRSAAYFKEAIRQVHDQGMDSKYYLTPLSELSEYYATHGDRDTALYWLKRYENAVQGTNNKVMLADARKQLMNMYISAGDRDKALQYSRLYVTAVDSLINTPNFINVTSRLERRAEEEDRSLIRDLEVTISKQKVFILGVAAALTLGLVIWLAVRRLRLDRNLLFARNRELAILETEMRAARCPVPAEDALRPEPEGEKWSALMKDIEEVMADPANFCNPDFSLQELANAIGSNTKYVSQAINETTGDNFRAYVNGFRIREARSRLTTDVNYTQLTIQCIGESVGFRSMSNFCIAFKKITGMTPSVYKKMAGKQNRTKDEAV